MLRVSAKTCPHFGHVLFNTPLNENNINRKLRAIKYYCNYCIVKKTKTKQKQKKNKAISMMRGKSPPPEFILEIIKSNNSF